MLNYKSCRQHTPPPFSSVSQRSALLRLRRTECTCHLNWNNPYACDIPRHKHNHQKHQNSSLGQAINLSSSLLKNLETLQWAHSSPPLPPGGPDKTLLNIPLPSRPRQASTYAAGLKTWTASKPTTTARCTFATPYSCHRTVNGEQRREKQGSGACLGHRPRTHIPRRSGMERAERRVSLARNHIVERLFSDRFQSCLNARKQESFASFAVYVQILCHLSSLSRESMQDGSFGLRKTGMLRRLVTNPKEAREVKRAS